MPIFQSFLNSLSHFLFFFLLLFTTTTLHQASATTTTNTNTNTTVHDLLPEFGFPKGLLPNAVKSYSFSSHGDFEVELERPCYVHFDDLVYYEKKINGKLKYGVISDVSGIQAKKMFVWVPITGIEVDSNSGFLEFHVGFLSEKLPVEQFQSIPSCKSKACGGRKSWVQLEVEDSKEEKVSVDSENEKFQNVPICESKSCGGRGSTEEVPFVKAKEEKDSSYLEFQSVPICKSKSCRGRGSWEEAQFVEAKEVQFVEAKDEKDSSYLEVQKLIELTPSYYSRSLRSQALESLPIKKQYMQ